MEVLLPFDSQPVNDFVGGELASIFFRVCIPGLRRRHFTNITQPALWFDRRETRGESRDILEGIGVPRGITGQAEIRFTSGDGGGAG